MSRHPRQASSNETIPKRASGSAAVYFDTKRAKNLIRSMLLILFCFKRAATEPIQAAFDFFHFKWKYFSPLMRQTYCISHASIYIQMHSRDI